MGRTSLGTDMSMARLDRVLDELVAIAGTRPDLQQFSLPPLDDGILDEIQRQSAPWLFPDEALHLAQRGGVLPGLYGWSLWPDLPLFPELPAPGPGRLHWEEGLHQDFQQDFPGREPTIRYRMIGSDPDREYQCVVPLMREPREDAPICFSNALDSLEVVSPSLAAFLESFVVALGAYTTVFGDEAEDFPDYDRYFDYFWWLAIHRSHAVDQAFVSAMAAPLGAINAAGQSDHPLWALRGSDEIIFNDSRLLWPES